MPATAPSAPSAEDFIAFCSFCAKPSTAVRRLVAGPGVYICDECIDLSATIVAEAANVTPEESARRLARYRERSTEDILAMLPALVRSAARVESELASWVSRLRERGTDWPAIATAAGVTVDDARQRFETPPAD